MNAWTSLWLSLRERLSATATEVALPKPAPMAMAGATTCEVTEAVESAVTQQIARPSEHLRAAGDRRLDLRREPVHRDHGVDRDLLGVVDRDRLEGGRRGLDLGRDVRVGGGLHAHRAGRVDRRAGHARHRLRRELGGEDVGAGDRRERVEEDVVRRPADRVEGQRDADRQALRAHLGAVGGLDRGRVAAP